MATFKIKRARNGEYYFNYVADNNQVIVKSETYTRKENARNGAQTIKDGARDAEIVDDT